MNQRALIVAVILFLVIVAGMFTYAYLRTNQTENTEPVVEDEVQDEEFAITHVDAKHFYTDGTHTVAGEVTMPTPCDLLDTNAVVRESAPEQVMISFDVINNSEGMCAQVLTQQRFKVSFAASADAEIEAMFRGEPVTLNLIEAEPGEDPDDFELFIKG